MKKNLFIVSAIFLIAAGWFSCSKGNTTECGYSLSDNIIGRWKLIEVSVRKHTNPLSPATITDYSTETIIFDFQKDNKLIVTGNIPDVIAVFDDFQAGEHFYEYSTAREHNCGYALPGGNLGIDETALWNKQYFCRIPLDEKTMSIYVIDRFIEGVIDYGLETGGGYFIEKRFIKVTN